MFHIGGELTIASPGAFKQPLVSNAQSELQSKVPPSYPKLWQVAPPKLFPSHSSTSCIMPSSQLDPTTSTISHVSEQ